MNPLRDPDNWVLHQQIITYKNGEGRGINAELIIKADKSLKVGKKYPKKVLVSSALSVLIIWKRQKVEQAHVSLANCALAVREHVWKDYIAWLKSEI